MLKFYKNYTILIILFLSLSAQAGNLSIVIDDFGYRLVEDYKVLGMPAAISVAVLPDAPHAHEIAIKAHQSGHEVLIHLPMVPMSKQSLEKNTLTPEMSNSQIGHILNIATSKVPYAVGVNNHMGSKMTSSLFGMQKVMKTLSHYNFYFLDSMTSNHSQSILAVQGTHVKLLKRRIFLDNINNEVSIRKQFIRAVKLAQKDTDIIAIGHPYPNTIHVLQYMLPLLPRNINLVKPSQLPISFKKDKPLILNIKLNYQIIDAICKCIVVHTLLTILQKQALNVIKDSMIQNPFIHVILLLV